VSDTVTQSPDEPDAATIAHIHARLTAVREGRYVVPGG
jgi:hypothetical protein